MNATEVTSGHALVLRTCAADMTSHGGFRWPESGPVACENRDPKPECGNGLHGLRDGVGNYSLLSDAPDARWLLLLVPADSIVSLGDKVKFPAAVVAYCGDRSGAFARLHQHWMKQARATSAYSSHAATSGYSSPAATSGDYSIAAAIGQGSRAKAGKNGAVIVGYWDTIANRPRVAVGYVGEYGIKPDTWYRAEAGKLVET